MKKDAIQGYGDEVIFFDRATDDLVEVINDNSHKEVHDKEASDDHVAT